MKAVPGLTLDYAHMYPRGYSEAEIERLIQYTSHFHARGVSNRDGTGSLEDNTLDWKRVFRVMDRTGYRGWIELEYGGNNVTDTVVFRDYFRKLLA